MYNYQHQRVIKRVACGVILSIMVNAIYVLSLYISFPYQFLYLIPFLTALLIHTIVKEKVLKKIPLSLFVIIFSNIFTEFMLDVTKVTNYFYYRRYPTADEIAIGEGVFMVFIYTLEIIGILIGTIFVYVSTWRKNKEKIK